jgi:hypothetical protein
LHKPGPAGFASTIIIWASIFAIADWLDLWGFTVDLSLSVAAITEWHLLLTLISDGRQHVALLVVISALPQGSWDR